ncbi:flagellar hook-length control protein FliK [Sinisalibacter aestuarii]|nr:flagellar hook-length control protein FliK [Sinisalibacter aestuarii]
MHLPLLALILPATEADAACARTGDVGESAFDRVFAGDGGRAIVAGERLAAIPEAGPLRGDMAARGRSGFGEVLAEENGREPMADPGRVRGQEPGRQACLSCDRAPPAPTGWWSMEPVRLVAVADPVAWRPEREVRMPDGDLQAAGPDTGSADLPDETAPPTDRAADAGGEAVVFDAGYAGIVMPLPAADGPARAVNDVAEPGKGTDHAVSALRPDRGALSEQAEPRAMSVSVPETDVPVRAGTSSERREPAQPGQAVQGGRPEASSGGASANRDGAARQSVAALAPAQPAPRALAMWMHDGAVPALRPVAEAVADLSPDPAVAADPAGRERALSAQPGPAWRGSSALVGPALAVERVPMPRAAPLAEPDMGDMTDAPAPVRAEVAQVQRTGPATPAMAGQIAAAPPPSDRLPAVIEVGIGAEGDRGEPQGEVPLAEPRLAHPAGHAPLAAPTPRPELARAVAVQIAEVVAQNHERGVELRLQPEELGRVSLTMSADGGVLSVALAADRGDTLDLMRRHIEILGDELRKLGYSSVAFSFAGGGDGHGTGAARTGPAPAPGTDGDDTEAGPVAAALPDPGANRKSNGIDMRL